MRGYPKIDTMYRRDENFNVITSDLRRPVLGTINKWIVTEKVDGTNIRINFKAPQTNEEECSYEIGGRTDNAQIHAGLFDHLSQLAWRIMPGVVDMMMDHSVANLTLFGEGYGEKIQNGGKYCKGQRFILFDVLINDKTWLDDDDVTGVASSLDVPRVPIIGEMSIEQMVEYVRWGFQSWVAEEDMAAEGVVARPLETLYDKSGSRLILKLKTKDFVNTNKNVVDLSKLRNQHIAEESLTADMGRVA